MTILWPFDPAAFSDAFTRAPPCLTVLDLLSDSTPIKGRQGPSGG